MPLYTALGFFVDPYLPGVVKGVFGYVVLGTYSILVHSWRLTILAWLATAVIAAAGIGYMVAAGIG